MIVLAAAALFLALLLTYLKSGEKAEARQPEKDTPLIEQPRPLPPPALSPGYLARLEQAVRQYRARRASSNIEIYREIRDKALELMSEDRYTEAANIIRQFPEELRTSVNWKTRLEPLQDEALSLAKMADEYSSTLSRVINLAEKENYNGAAVLLEQYAVNFADSQWAGEAIERAAMLRKLQIPQREPSVSKKSPEPAQPKPAPQPPRPEPKKMPEHDEFREKIVKAISRGVGYVRLLGKSDGSFVSGYSYSYPAGPSALALLTLLKCGEDRDSKIIANGFEYLSKKPLRRTYSASLYMLALEAKFEPHGEEIDPRSPFDQQLKKRFSRYASKAEKEKASSIVSWLRDAQLSNGMWSYAGLSTSSSTNRRRRIGRGDGSNTQFAVLALYDAHRLGVTIPKETVSRLANAYLENQQRNGPKIKAFPVPAADMPIQKLRQAEKKALNKKKGPHTVRLDELYGGTTGRHSMHAKGWGYSGGQRSGAYLSMTCAGVCNMVLAKAVLERTSGYARSRDKIDQSIRNGTGYISRNLEDIIKHARRTGRNGWGLYYTLYSVERAGMLTLCEKFGKHLWYKEGAKALMNLQNPDGSWGNSLEDTCFALLFLSRSTTPFIRTSGTIYTGSDLFPGKKK
jgi:hypothetical protein